MGRDIAREIMVKFLFKRGIDDIETAKGRMPLSWAEFDDLEKSYQIERARAKKELEVNQGQVMLDFV